jgi:sensor histidine kinase YesM
MARINWSRVGLHVIFWLVYIVLNALLNHIYDRVEHFPEAMLGELFSLPPKICLVYFIFYYIIPLYLDRSKVVLLILLIVAAFAFCTVFYRVFVGYFYFNNFDPGRNFVIFNTNGVVLTLFDLFITTAAATTIKMIRVHYKSIEFEQELIREKLQSELSFLRAQTNPHFLFNTLNNLFVLARKKSDKTADAIMMLSKIMRFVLYECRQPRISVSDEAKVIQDYIELEKLRYNKRLTVDYQEDTDNSHASIAPLLLLPFVENSFKHGAGGTTGDVVISIMIYLRNNHLTFTVKNTVDDDQDLIGNSGGIGLRNVQRQLDLLYADHYSLKTGREGGYFVAELKINLAD